MLSKLHKKFIKDNALLIAILFLIILNLSFIGYQFFNSRFLAPDKANTQPVASLEIQQIISNSDPKIREKLYTKLIERVGPVIAQEDLLKSGLPFDGQTHLLNHTVGDWIYDKYGTDGLIQCKDYFLSSCYHGFVIKAIAENGLSILDKVMSKCNSEGPTTATQCAHAIGHGLLAWEGYKNLPQALIRCDELINTSENFPVFNCQDGVFMENIWAVHENGEPSPDRWIDKADPAYPCNSPEIATQYRKACWSNQPQLMYQFFTQDFEKIAAECEKLLDEDLKSTCYDSIARQIHPVANGSLETTFNLCKKMPGKWNEECLLSNVSASYSVGDRVVPFEICRLMTGKEHSNCMSRLINMILTYSKSEKEYFEMCQNITDINWRNKCISNPI